MARPDVYLDFETPGGPVPVGARAHLRLKTRGGVAYVTGGTTAIGGFEPRVLRGTRITWQDVRPNVGASADVITNPPGSCYELELEFPGLPPHRDLLQVPDVAGPLDITSLIVPNPDPYPPLAKIFLGWLLSVDGAGSGLDADRLDGQHASYFASAAALSAAQAATQAGIDAVYGAIGAAVAQGEAYTDAAVAALAETDPGLIQTLNDLRDLLGDDPDYGSLLSALVPQSEKGAAGGVPELDADSRVLPGQLPGVLRAAGDGSTDDRDALAAVSGSPATVLLAPGTYRVGSDVTLTGSMEMFRGAVLKPDNGVTITLDAEFTAGRWQTFDVSAGGSVVFADTARTATVMPEWWGVVADGATDNGSLTHVFAGCPLGSSVRFGKGVYVVGGSIITKEVVIEGIGKHTVLRANGISGQILYFQGTSPAFLDGCVVKNITFDGNSRAYNLTFGAIRMRDFQRAYFNNVWITDVDGAAFYLQRAVRNSWFDRIYINNCGNHENNQPHIHYSTVTSGVTQGADGHNNNHWTNLESLYPIGDHIRSERFSSDSAVRNNFFTDCMFHGGNSSDYRTTNVVLRTYNGRLWYFAQCRMHSTNKGWPLMLLAQMPSGSTTNQVNLSGISFGGVASGSSAFAASTGDTLVCAGHGFATGALVRVTGGSLPSGLSTNTDYYVIRVDEDTIRLAADRVDAEFNGVPVASGSSGAGTIVAQEVKVLVEAGNVAGTGLRFDGGVNRADLVAKGSSTLWLDGSVRASVEGLSATNLPLVADSNGVVYRPVVDTSGNLSTTAP